MARRFVWRKITKLSRRSAASQFRRLRVVSFAKRWTATGEEMAAHQESQTPNPPAQFVIHLLVLLDAMRLECGEGEAAQGADEEKCEPDLQPPAYGFDEHGAYSQ